MWDKTFNLIVLIIVIRVSSVVITRFINSSRSSNMENKLKFGLVSRCDLAQISDNHFINWCYSILGKMNFSKIDIVSGSLKDNIQICAYENKNKIYLRCIKSEYTTNPKSKDDFQEVAISDIQKLIGTMEHDEVYTAWVITNGNFNKDVLHYVETLPENYSITLIDGRNLTKLHRHYQKQYITS